MFAVIGGGPAGTSAALALAHEGEPVVLFEQQAHLGGQLWHSCKAQNIPGCTGQPGFHIAQQWARDLVAAGVELRLNTPALVTATPGGVMINGTFYEGAVIATGRALRVPDVPGRDHPRVSTGMTVPDPPGLASICIVGHGNAAGQAVREYHERGITVHWLVHGTCRLSPRSQEDLRDKERVEAVVLGFRDCQGCVEVLTTGPDIVVDLVRLFPGTRFTWPFDLPFVLLDTEGVVSNHEPRIAIAGDAWLHSPRAGVVGHGIGASGGL